MSWSLGMTVQKEPSGKLILTMPEGNTYNYIPVYNVENSENVTEYEYDKFNRHIKETKARATTTYTINYTDKLVGITDTYNNITAYEYDKMGNMIKSTNAIGQSTNMTYDLARNMLTSISPEGTILTFTYDHKGNVLTAKDENGNITTNSYDPNGNLVKTVYADNSEVK